MGYGAWRHGIFGVKQRGGHGESYLGFVGRGEVLPRAHSDGMLPCSMNFDESGALVVFRPSVGRHRYAQLVLLDPMVEHRRLRFDLAMVAVWCRKRRPVSPRSGHQGMFYRGKYYVKCRDSTAKSIPKLLLESAMFVRILASFKFWG
jgi:hypothetical protein